MKFFNFLAVLCGIFVFHFIIGYAMQIWKHNLISKQLKTKERWVEQRSNAEKIQEHRTLPKSQIKPPHVLLDWWSVPLVILVISNIFQFIAGLLVMFSDSKLAEDDEFDYDSSIGTLLGMGTCLSFINFLNILSEAEGLKIVVEAIKKSFSGFMYILIGVLPVYFAYLFGGYAAFHSGEKFATLTLTNATLGALLCGDEILDFLNYFRHNFGPIGLIYSLSFCVLFVVCIHNVLIYIINEAFKEQGFKFEKMHEKNQSKQKREHSDQFLKDQVPELKRCVVSEELHAETPIITAPREVDKMKDRVFSRVIPQSREAHIFEMNLKKDMIRGDIKFLKETLQNLVVEPIGISYFDNRQ